MRVEITARTVVDGVWLEIGNLYDLPSHRCKELFDRDRAKPARSAPIEAAIEPKSEDVMERPGRKWKKQ